MGIESDSQLLEPGNMVVLFELDCTGIGGDQLFFHGHAHGGSIVWQGATYKAWPIQAEGFAITGEGQQAAPTLRVANVDGSIGALCIYLKDLVGSRLVRRRTLAKYLDAVNFPEGNVNADPEQRYADDIYFVEQKIAHDKAAVGFMLKSALDLSDVFLPRRLIIANVCSWLTHGGYRGPNCAYTGEAMFDKDDNPTPDPSQDKCGGRVSSCKLRFVNQDLRYGGFPSASLTR